MSATISQDKTIWIIESCPEQKKFYNDVLAVRYQVRYFSCLSSFMELVKADLDIKPNLIIAEVKSETGNFINALAKYKMSSISDVPLVICSNFDDMDAIRFSFDSGAVDFLTKPLKKNEFLIKIENVLCGKNIFVSAPGPYDSTLKGFATESLTSKQTRLLSLFVCSPTKTINRTDILKSVWGDTVVHPKTVDVHLYNLRRKIKEQGYSIRSKGGGKWMLVSDKEYSAVHN